MRWSRFFGAAVVVSTLALVGVPAGSVLAEEGSPAPTTTTVVCDPSTLAVNTSTACTATVTGEGGTPNGVVDWSSDGAGTFDFTECTLVAGSCAVNYTPTACDSPTITGAYTPTPESSEGGDSVRDDSESNDGDSDDFAASAGQDGPLTVTGCGPPAGPKRYLPDNLIRKAAKGSRWFGEGIINGTGAHQRVHDYTHAGDTRAFYITVENDGNAVDTIVVGGRGLQHGYKSVKYLLGKKNITRQVAGHGYAFRNMAPQAQHVIKLVITSFRTAGPSFRTWQVLSRSTRNPFKRDAVAATITIRRA